MTPQTIMIMAIFSLMPISASFGSDETDAETLAGNEVEPMPASIARVRIQQAMDHATPFEDRHSILSEVVARCEDHQLRSIASYNMGIAYIRRQPTDPGSLADAVEWLRQADTEGTSSELRVRARDSIGHAWYLMARADHETQDTALNPTDLRAMKDQLVDQLEQLIVSASAFRAAHDVDRSYRPAIENLERVRQEVQRIRDQINSLEELIEQQQKQAQQRQQQQQETAERLEELAEQQQQEANENTEQSSKTPEEQSQQAEDQDELCNQTQSEQEGLSEQQDDSEAMQEVEEQLQSARDAQERAQESLEQGNMEEAAKAQEEAAEALERAANKLREMSENGTEGKNGGEPEPQQEGDGEEQEPQQSQGEDAEEPPQEISEIAQQLLDKERRERERRKARRTPRVVPVERDW